MDRLYMLVLSLGTTMALLTSPTGVRADGSYDGFDDWPDTPCFVGADATACGGNALGPTALSEDELWVGVYAGCGLKCVRARYHDDREVRSYLPNGGRWAAHPHSVYFQFDLAFDDDVFGDLGAQMPTYTSLAATGTRDTELFRVELGMKAAPGGEVALALHNFSRDVAGQPFGMGPGQLGHCPLTFRPESGLQYAVRVEVVLNSEGVADGSCRTEVRSPLGSSVRAGNVDWIGPNPEGGWSSHIFEETRLLGRMENSSDNPLCPGDALWPPCGGETTRTLFIDHVCVAPLRSDRMRVCSVDFVPDPPAIDAGPTSGPGPGMDPATPFDFRGSGGCACDTTGVARWEGAVGCGGFLLLLLLRRRRR